MTWNFAVTTGETVSRQRSSIVCIQNLQPSRRPLFFQMPFSIRQKGLQVGPQSQRIDKGMGIAIGPHFEFPVSLENSCASRMIGQIDLMSRHFHRPSNALYVLLGGPNTIDSIETEATKHEGGVCFARIDD